VLAALSNSKALWYLARGTGLVTLILLTGTVLLGIVAAKRWTSRQWPRFVTVGLHKNLSLLAVALLAVHIGTVVADSYVHISWFNAFVPFTGAYRPMWLGLGAVAGDLLIALIITSLLRKRVGYRVWRAVHWLAYACWPSAVLHGLTIGSDRRSTWALGVTYGCIAAVGAAALWRAAMPRLAPRPSAVGARP